GKDTLTTELASVEESLDRPAPQAPAIDPGVPSRIDAINKRMSELDSAITQKQKAGQGDQTGGEQAEKDRLQSELGPLMRALIAPRPASPARDPNLVKHAADLRAQIGQLDAEIRNATSQLTTPKNERDTLVAQLTALQVQRQSLPDPDVLRQSGGAVITAAEMPTTPASPKLGLNLAMALALGSMLGVGFAFLAENLDDRVRSTEEVEERVGAPVLGHVPYVVEWADSPEPLLATVHEPTSGAAEAYRTLRTNLRFLSLERPLQTILVTSSLASEGKSTTAANLAVALAEGGTQTVLVSADLRRPSIHRFFELADTGGIVAALEGTVSAEGALMQTRIPNLRLLPAGGRPPNPTEILASSRFGELLESLASVSDLVLIDAPPALGLADASALASKVDGVLFLVDAHEVARRSLSHAAEQIRKAGGRILGTIMNGVVADESGYDYYYNYYYAYSDEGSRSDRGRGRDGERGRKGRRGAGDEPAVVDLQATSQHSHEGTTIVDLGSERVPDR
ncbi:MAG TPA: polysaccharide biosynthesis tyrosine autokinase, partial [Actinomycetota bacterium]